MDARMAQYPQINVTHHINKMKAKNHMIISMAAKKKKKKKADKILHQLRTKTLNKLGKERMYLNIIKTMGQAHSQYHTQWCKAVSFSSKIRKRHKWHPSTFLHNAALEVLVKKK